MPSPKPPQPPQSRYGPAWWATAVFVRIDALRMPDPDNDPYDAGYNEAIDRALREVNALVQERGR